MDKEAEVSILRELLAAGDAPVSGNRLAETLGVSRVAVWGWIDRLRKAGFALEGRPKAGYRLTGLPADLSETYLRASLPDAVLYVHEEIDSTNSEAERLLARGEPAPFAVAARRQTGGRGRRGRSWFSGEGGNLCLSLAFRPALPPARMGTFTLWTGVVLAGFLRETTGVPIFVKWPNDLMFERRKLGGILTEARMDSDQMRELVFGLGLNVNGDPRAWPPEIRETAASLRQAAGRSHALNPLAAALIRRMLEACEEFFADPPPPAFRSLWESFDLLNGREVGVLQGGETLRGRAEGIDEDGSLLLRAPGGRLLRLRAGDVTLEKEATP